MLLIWAPIPANLPGRFGITGFGEVLSAVYPQAALQLCIVHKVRKSLHYVPYKERKTVAADLRAIYGAATLGEAEVALERFAERWDAKYPVIKVLYLAIQRAAKRWTMPIRNWVGALNRFTIMFPERMPV